ncbi:MAG: hypothetical protein MUC63_01645 [Planctomycetes bacterium]|jgi:hypothetical protein|nr:hypothetical protein [Planctomycetota bacterium]
MPYSWDEDHDSWGSGSDSGGGYSFTDARKSYDDVAVGKKDAKAFYTFRSPFPKTDSPYPIVVGVDTTGSMKEWPKIFFEKLPLLYREAVKYYPGCEISFQAINDFPADGADVALQPAPFGKGPQLDEFIGQLYPFGGGGGQGTESYEVFAAYNSFLQAPKAVVKPIAIILGDESPFNEVPREVCEHYGLGRGESVPSRVAFERLHRACDVYLVRKPYWGPGAQDEPMVKRWVSVALMPRERILEIQDPRRVVDVILGILGVLTGKSADFEKELVARQSEGQVQEVLNSLQELKRSVHRTLAGPTQTPPGLAGGAKRSRGLDLDV